MKDSRETSELPLYQNALLYQAWHDSYTSDIPFYIDEATKCGGDVLEIACGTGRITIPVAKAGVPITGLDISPDMIDVAQDLAQKAGVDIRFLIDDCTTFELNEKFPLIFFPFNSFQHLGDYQLRERCLHRILDHLEPGGRFIVDLFNPSIERMNRDPDRRYPVGEFAWDDDLVTVEEKMRYYDATQHIECEWFFSTASKPDFKRLTHSMSCIYPLEADHLFESTGFRIVEKFGNFERKVFGDGDPKQIFLLTKSVKAAKR